MRREKLQSLAVALALGAACNTRQPAKIGSPAAAPVVDAAPSPGALSPKTAALPALPASAGPSEAAPVMVRTPDEAARLIGKRVSLSGAARDAKMSAAVVIDDLAVYCLNRDSWGEGLAGKQLTVEGLLERSADFQATRGANGVVTQGTEQPVFVIRACQVR